MIDEKVYREILMQPIKECASYTPKFGHSKEGGFSLSDFQTLYGNDLFYKWLGLDSPLMYSAHKAAGGITSVYRQIGIGCERLVRQIFMDYLEIDKENVNWSYEVSGSNGKTRKLSLDARIIIDSIPDLNVRKQVSNWIKNIAKEIGVNNPKSIEGIVFEVRQGYKSKDSKRQNADIANAANAYKNHYIPCLMVMSSQIDDDLVTRYEAASWLILRGFIGTSNISSTYDFFKEIIGYDLANFLMTNQKYFQDEITEVLSKLMEAK